MSAYAFKNSVPLFGQSLEGVELSGLRDHGYAGRNRIDFMALPLIAEGGEGWVLDGSTYRSGEVIKLFKPPAMTMMEEAARQKWDEYPRKLAELAKLDLPDAAVRPTLTIGEKRGGSALLGYFMPRIDGIPLTSLTSQEGRQEHRFSRQNLTSLFQKIVATVQAVHEAGAVIGDAKPHNILIRQGAPKLIDIESIQFGEFTCHGFTEDYTDPLICDNTLDFIEKIKPYIPECDWYAIEVMLFECLTGIHPFSGVHKPAGAGSPIPDSARSLRGVSVLNPSVGVPSFVEPFVLMPLPLRQHFLETFEGRIRRPLVDRDLDITWRTCNPCMAEYAAASCPLCTEETHTSQLKRSNAPLRSVTFETIRGEGAAAHLSFSRDDGRPLITRVDSHANGQLRLRLNGKIVTDNVPADASVLCIPDQNSVYLAQGGSVHAHLSGRAYPLILDRVSIDMNGKPLLMATNHCLAYLNQSGDLILESPHKKGSSIRYPLHFTEARHLVIGKQPICVASKDSLAILHVETGTKKLISYRIPLSRSFQLVSMDVHPVLPYTLMTSRNSETGQFSARVLDLKGNTTLEMNSAKRTLWWFSQRRTDPHPAIFYWQDEKLCEALVNTTQRNSTLLWGMKGIAEPDPGSAPVLANEHIYLLSGGELKRTSIQ